MNKKKKTLLIGIIVLIVLIGAMLALLLTQPKDDNATSSTVVSAVAEDVYLYQEEEGSLKTLEITNSSGSYSIEQVGEKKWGIKELDDYKADTDSYADTAERYTTLSAKEKLMDKVTDKKKYGLDKPTGTGVATFANGNKHTVYVGNKTPDDAGYYAMVDDDESLYIITVMNAELLQKSKLSYLNKTLIQSFDKENAEETPTIEGMTIERKDLDYKIVMEKADKKDDDAQMYSSSLKMVQPVACDLDSKHADEEIIYTLFGLTAEEAVAIDAESVKSKYGFDKPFATIVLEYDGRTVKMVFGDKADDESYYMMFNKNNVIYRVKTASVAALTVDPNTLVSSLGILPFIDDVKTMSIKMNNKTYQYELTGKDDDLKITLDGKKVDTDNFKQLYQLVLNPSLDAIYTGKVSGSPTVSITFSYHKGGSDTMELYDDGGRQMIFALNGVANRTGRSAYLGKLEREIENLVNGKKVDTTW